MDYKDIPVDTKKYIRKSTYVGMAVDEREIYLDLADKMMHKLLISTDKPDEHKKVRKLNSRNIKFVGMRFYGDHIFSADDKIRLEHDDFFFRANSLKVMLRKSKKWKHVAYVERGDAKWLNTIDGYMDLPLKFLEGRHGLARYTIDLRPLEDEGIEVKTKIAVLGKLGVCQYYFFDELWHNYPDLDYLFTLPGE
jgi:hypothetical protein